MEDIDTHYELSYSPQIDKYDGHFRKISVKIARNDIRVQTRSGYFALPAMEGQSVMPYEVAHAGSAGRQLRFPGTSPTTLRLCIFSRNRAGRKALW